MPEKLVPWAAEEPVTEVKRVPWVTDTDASNPPQPKKVSSTPRVAPAKDGRGAILSLFPSAYVTDWKRDPNSNLGRANTTSFHNRRDSAGAVDIRRIPGMSFNDYVSKIREAGYPIIEARDEYANPSPHATGPHWHVTIGEREGSAPAAPEGEKLVPWETTAEAPAPEPFVPKMNRPASEAPFPIKDTDVTQWDPSSGKGVPEGHSILTEYEQTSRDYFTGSLDRVMMAPKGKRPTKKQFIADVRKNAPAVVSDDALIGYAYDEYAAGRPYIITWNSRKREDPNVPKNPLEGLPFAEKFQEEVIDNGPVASAPPALTPGEVLQKKFTETLDPSGTGINAGFLRGLINMTSSEEDKAKLLAKWQERRQGQEQFWNDQGERTMNPVRDEVAKFAGETGGMITPLDILGPGIGKTALGRVLGAGGVNAAEDIVSQTLEGTQGLREQYDPLQTVTAAAGGAALQGAVFEPLGMIIKRYARKSLATETFDNPKVVGVDEPATTGTTPRGKVNKKQASVAAEVAKTTKGWVNSPEIVVHGSKGSFTKAEPELAEKLRQDKVGNRASGFYGEDGRLHVLSYNVKDVSNVKSLVFHEALGHDGLAKSLGDDLDTVMTDLYNRNPKIRAEAERLGEGAYKGVYADDVRIPRLVEEAYAKRSEAGVISMGIIDRFRAAIAPYVRKLGLTMDLSDAEVKAILADAHAMITKGGKAADRGNVSGLRYVLTTHVSPHDFENIDAENPYGKFDHSKMGTGEGAQVYSWGTYLGENTRDNYFRKFSREMGSGAKIGDTPISQHLEAYFDKDFSARPSYVYNATKMVDEDFSYYSQNKEDYKSTADFVNKQLDNYLFSRGELDARSKENPDNRFFVEEREKLDYIIDAYRYLSSEYIEVGGKAPKTYEVDVTDELQERMLKWDKPLEDQPQAVRDAAEELGMEHISKEKMLELEDERAQARDATTKWWEENIRGWEDARVKAQDDAYYAEQQRLNTIPLEDYDKIPELAKLLKGEAFTPSAVESALDTLGWKAATKAGNAYRKNNPIPAKVMKEYRRLAEVEDKITERMDNARYLTGENFYAAVVDKKGSPQAASEYLAEKGIPGNKYEDGFSRGKYGDKSYNYVMYNDKGPDAPKIINKYMLEDEDTGVTDIRKARHARTQKDNFFKTEWEETPSLAELERRMSEEDARRSTEPSQEVKDWLDAQKGPIKSSNDNIKYMLEDDLPQRTVKKFMTAMKSARLLNEKFTEDVKADTKAKMKELAKARKSSSGRAGLYTELAALTGKTTRPAIEPFEEKFTQKEADALFNIFKNDKAYGWLEGIRARTAMEKLFEGQVPTRGELELLQRVLPKDFIKYALDLRTGGDKASDFFMEFVNFQKAMRASLDLSGGFRQGIWLQSRKEFWKNFREQGKHLSDKFHEASKEAMREDPYYAYAVRGKLDLTDLGVDYRAREEDFQSRVAEKVPGVRRSGQAYTGLLNGIRFDTFKHTLQAWEKQNVVLTDDLVKSLANYINNATGRGAFGNGKFGAYFEKARPFIGLGVWSPGLLVSRFNVLFNPLFYTKMHPLVRRQAARDWVSNIGVTATLLGLASFMGASVETDPRSSDFLKIRVGKNRYDITGGFGGYLTLAARMVTGETKTLKGHVKKLGPKSPNGTTGDVLGRFARGKAAPFPAYMLDALNGENVVGEPFDPVKNTVQQFVPMSLWDLGEGYVEGGLTGAAKRTPSLLGISSNSIDVVPDTYDYLGRNVNDEVVDPEIDTELKRLSATTDSGADIISPVTKANLPKGPVRDKGDPKDIETLQRVSGDYIRKDLKQTMATPEWKLMTDEEKVELVNKIERDQRKNAREDLFPEAETETEKLVPWTYE